MQRRRENGKRPRISVSLDPADYEWVKNFKGPSESYTVSRIVRAARLAGLSLKDASDGGVLTDFSKWLGSKRKNKLASDLHLLLDEFLADR